MSRPSPPLSAETVNCAGRPDAMMTRLAGLREVRPPTLARPPRNAAVYCGKGCFDSSTD